jgi:lipid-A-disaccharide synthase-like uncharacterized protein
LRIAAALAHAVDSAGVERPTGWRCNELLTMNSPIFHVFNVVITPWKLIGYLGVLLFAGRWVVQVLATRRHGKPVIPLVFWLMSIGGSALLCAYFIWGKNDSVGLISNLFPMGVAIFNLIMDMRSRQPAAPAVANSMDPPQRLSPMNPTPR